MNRHDRERARRLSDYADSLVVAHRTRDEQVRVYGREDTEFPELANLARELTGIRLIPPADFAHRLERGLRAAERRAGDVGTAWSRLRSAIDRSVRHLSRLFPRIDSSAVVRGRPLRH